MENYDKKNIVRVHFIYSKGFLSKNALAETEEFALWLACVFDNASLLYKTRKRKGKKLAIITTPTWHEQEAVVTKM